MSFCGWPFDIELLDIEPLDAAAFCFFFGCAAA
jgi:hypothetical protein